MVFAINKLGLLFSSNNSFYDYVTKNDKLINLVKKSNKKKYINIIKN